MKRVGLLADAAEARIKRETADAANGNARAKPQRPHVDPDEVILVYPPGRTGAVNITNSDVSRLTPGEFLNDTLIEFGLKLWLQDLEKEDPELAKEIHVFGSFFYKKLNKKNPREGYESVRKWTAKFDLFDKKYIIVPINENLHWYLAIIYQPEHTLKPPPPTKSPATRRKTLQGAEQSGASDKPEVHDIDERDSLFGDHMDVDTRVDPDQFLDPLDLFADDPSLPTVSEPVKTVNSNSAKSRGKRKATSPPLEALPVDSYEEEDVQPWTYVFTFDSLGSRHPKVTNVLAQYLKFEAQERKGIPLEMSRKAIGKIALVPHQPNFCDAGIYLLHLAETFISNPMFYHNLIMKQKGYINSLDRQLQWNDDRTKTLRQKLTERIGELSKEWKKNRAAQKEFRKTQEEVVAESSDDPPRMERTPKTGKVMRMRG
ncbi:hypothetical protein B0H19DRAFT_1108938 [Mycena capillaripes]|nr:hypothetical protein B0H19DRAFT_1108938 [Mycena capillaripes]